MPVDNRFYAWISFAVVAAIGTVAYCMMPWWTVDDAFISYRYGRNLVEAGELTWNVGMPPVEGYTGIFLPLLASALLLLGIPMVAAIKVLGILATAATLVLAHDSMRRLGIGHRRRSLAFIFLGATPLLYLHSISGLETTFFTLFVTWVFHGLADQSQLFTSGKTGYGLGLALLMTGLCRPEGMALLLVVVILVFVSNKRFSPFIFRTFVLKLLFMAGLPMLLYWGWRYGYYGSVLPNTYYAKAYEGLVNIESAMAFGKFFGYYLLIPLLLGFLLNSWRQKLQPPAKHLFPMAALLFSGACMASYFHSNLWMNYGSRFFVPFLPLGIISIAYIAQPKPMEEHPAPSKRWKTALLAMLVLGQIAILGFRYRQEWAFLKYYDAIVQDELIPIGRHLHAEFPASTRVISYMDAGAIGFYSGVEIVDFGRLNDPYLARNVLSQQAINDYFYLQDADLVVMSSTAANVISYIPEAMGIVADPRFQRYEEIGVWGNQFGYPYWQHVFRKRQSPKV